MSILNRSSKRITAAAVNEVPDATEIKRRTIVAIQSTQALRKKQNELRSAQQDHGIAENALDRKVAAQLVSMLNEEVAELEAEKQQAERAVKLAESAAAIPEIKRRQAQTEPLATEYLQLITEADRDSKALAVKLERIALVAERIHALNAGGSRSLMDRMGSAFHVTNLRLRLSQSIPAQWPTWISCKMLNSHYRMFPSDRPNLLSEETKIINNLRQNQAAEITRLEAEIKKLKEEVTNAKQRQIEQ